jgi:hypothetical protein
MREPIGSDLTRQDNISYPHGMRPRSLPGTNLKHIAAKLTILEKLGHFAA